MNTIYKYLYHKFIDKPTRWHPILSVYYLTYACSFRCPYCSDGEGKPYYLLPNKTLPPDDVMNILSVIRRYCDYIVITGGEPLEYPAFDRLFERIKTLKFREVILTTNGFAIADHIQPIMESVTSLVFSLDTLDHEKADRWYGAGNGNLQKILGNIENIRNLKKRSLSILISSVVTPENIEDLYEVYAYSRQRKFVFAACPQLMGVKAHEALSRNDDYRRFYDFLINEKKSGRLVYGTVKYLEYMRDLTKFDCHPFTMLVVSPTGDVYYPCLEKGRLAGNLSVNSDIHSIRTHGLRRFGPQPVCGNQCHSACALGFALILKYPRTLVHEACMMAKSTLVNAYEKRY